MRGGINNDCLIPLIRHFITSLMVTLTMIQIYFVTVPQLHICDYKLNRFAREPYQKSGGSINLSLKSHVIS